VRLSNNSAGRAAPEEDDEMDPDAETNTTDRRFWQNRMGRTRRRLEDKIEPEAQKEWLASNARWTYGLAVEYVGVKVLGVGGFGVVGLWEYTGLDGQVARVVVKQSKGQDQSLKSEGVLLHAIAERNTRHVVRLLKQYHEEKGQGTSRWDPEDEYVSRIYLEFCENGDMVGFIKNLYA
jgi:hypothetical protein